MTALPTTPEARFAAIIDLLYRAVAARIAGGRLAAPLIVLICTRLRRLGARFAALAARVRAGRLPAPRVPGPRRPAATPRPRSPLPRGAAWLVRLVPEAASGASQLQYLLSEPEMAALIAAAPQAGRILRPLCHMLGIRLPAALARPPRPAAAAPSAPTPRPPPRRPAPAAPPHPWPTRGPPVETA